MKRKRRKTSPPGGPDRPGEQSQDRQDQSGSFPVSRRRQWLFRIAAMLLAPLILVVLLEIGLRLTGVGYPAGFFLRATVQGHPVWIENRRFGWRFFPSAIARTPGATVLPISKPPRTFRVFVLGESAAFGDPKAEFGLPRQLAVLLRDRFSTTPIEVVNVAMTAINSHVILPIARECAGREGDLWVIYMGNNEVVGPYGAGTVFGRQVPPLWLVRAGIALKATRAGQLLDAAMGKLTGSHGTPQTWTGLEMFAENRLAAEDPRLSRVYTHFRDNLEDILRAAARAGAKVVLCTVATNLKDCAPFASLNRTNLVDAEKKEWERCWLSGLESEALGKAEIAADSYRRAAQLDPSHAETMFRQARCQLAMSNTIAAKSLFAQARDLDALRFRADRRLNEIIHQTASRWPSNQVSLVDAEEIFDRASGDGITGNEFFLEHVHFNFAGNYLLARSIAERVAELAPALAAQRAAGHWLTLDESAQRLAFTDWSRLDVANLVRDRISRAPFTFQCDHAKREQLLTHDIGALQSALSPAVLASMMEIHRRALVLAPDDWFLLENLARLGRQAGDPEESAKASRRVTELLPHRSEGWLEYGLSLEQLGRLGEAEASLNQALALQPGDVRALCALGRTRLQEKRFSEATNHFAAALRYQPDSQEAYLGLGDVWASLGDTEKALTHYRKALAFNPANPIARSNLLSVINREGQLSQRIQLLEAAVQANPREAVTRLELGRALFLAGRPSEAGPHFAAAVELSPDISEAHYFLGLEMVRQGRLDEAQTQFAEAVRLRPDDVDALLNYGVSLARSRRFAQAITQFEKVLRLQPENSVARHYIELSRAQSDQPKQ
jgi:tetratricopeptide (TPR) repeat protein